MMSLCVPNLCFRKYAHGRDRPDYRCDLRGGDVVDRGRVERTGTATTIDFYRRLVAPELPMKSTCS